MGAGWATAWVVAAFFAAGGAAFDCAGAGAAGITCCGDGATGLGVVTVIVGNCVCATAVLIAPAQPAAPTTAIVKVRSLDRHISMPLAV